MEAAIEAGAEDVVNHGADGFEVRTHPNDLHAVAAALEKRFKLGPRRVGYFPKDTVKLADADKARTFLKLLEALEDLDDVQKVEGNFDMDVEEMAKA